MGRVYVKRKKKGRGNWFWKRLFDNLSKKTLSNAE
jgi:hypothetical protein